MLDFPIEYVYTYSLQYYEENRHKKDCLYELIGRKDSVMYDRYSSELSEKDRIFNVAIQFLEKVGYERLSIRKICAEANISVGKFYTYFKNKQELLSHFYNIALEDFEEKIKSEDFSKLNLQEKITEFYGIYMEFTQNFGVEFVMHYFSNQNEEMDIHRNNNHIMMVTDGFITEEVQKGYVLPEGRSVHDISIDLCMIVKGIIFTWVAERGGFDLPQVTRDIYRRAIKGILPM
ncbi:MAG: TetR/AcrR family transcriptional regulator [Oscillospiraceae bacterium]|nr:TetR/AcrR family transcriptional regulator [Oscillospiraceae bacterium]